MGVTQRHDKGGTPHNITNFLGFGRSTIGTIFEGGGEEEEEEAAAAPHQCSHQHSLKSALFFVRTQ